MPTFELTSEEHRLVLEILERAHHNLRVEIVNTDKREFRRALKQREVVMEKLIERMKNNYSEGDELIDLYGKTG